MNAWLQLPQEIQLALVACLGAIVGGQVNRGIYRLAWDARSIGPWSRPLPEAPPRRWTDRLPILGWLGLRRESPLHGAGYWIRPLLIEAMLAVGFAWLYFQFVEHRVASMQAVGVVALSDDALGQFLRLSLLLALMTIATFIDFDEQTIPDAVTVPGTIAALILAAVLPFSGLDIIGESELRPLLLSSPLDWPSTLSNVEGLATGIVCVVLWCLALVPRTWTLRKGWRRAVQFALASMVRNSIWWKYMILAVILSSGVAATWMIGGTEWESLLSALIGMAFGGGLVWIIRVIAGTVLEKEAMGFGDVTLMGMIGAFLGWQPSLVIFFLAPFAALFVSLAQWIITRRRDIAFGPYLCFGTCFVIVRWDSTWDRTAALFQLGTFIPMILAFCFVAMGVLLYAWRWIEAILFGHSYDDDNGAAPRAH